MHLGIVLCWLYIKIAPFPKPGTGGVQMGYAVGSNLAVLIFPALERARWTIC